MGNSWFKIVICHVSLSMCHALINGVTEIFVKLLDEAVTGMSVQYISVQISHICL